MAAASDMFQVARGAAAGLPDGQRDEQWVDGPTSPYYGGATDAAARAPPAPGAAAAATPQQDMLFQWVDYPGPYRPGMHQQHLFPQGMHMGQLGNPYYGGADVASPFGAAGMAPGADMGMDQRVRSSDRPGRESRRQQHAGEDGGAKGRNRQGGGRDGGGGGGAEASGNAARAPAPAPEPPPVETVDPVVARELLSGTLESIYRDRIKPMGNYVKGRLKERECPEVMVKQFQEYYSKFPDVFQVSQPAGADEVSIMFVREPPWFKGWVDIDSPDDDYDEKMWEDFAEFLNGEHTFAGGRYGMARELMQRNLPFLAPYSLGEICHIVQLAIQPRKLILYHRKMLKPIQTIMCQPPAAVNGVPGSAGEEITDMDQLCLILFRTIIRYPQGIQLSRMKQMIKREFGASISEMAFQCTKLSELFAQEPLADTFTLEIKDSGKSMYVRLRDDAQLTPHTEALYAQAKSVEAKRHQAVAVA
eukprot:TRINITY_DN31482_c0_g1_i1.p1 TRINITY_DN31482_c0_g1~~TRINITY_DN31482_c0_g1_i1.p1  ORF type:complete len:521 (-),score=97.70 TRINITY_DN31482_c0_g1_i1:118-1542(-)